MTIHKPVLTWVGQEYLARVTDPSKKYKSNNNASVIAQATPEQLQAACACRMAKFDALPLADRRMIHEIGMRAWENGLRLQGNPGITAEDLGL